MDQSLKVTIIINNYNYGHFITEAIDSALAQSYPNVEVIVVDDGSTDDSRRAIEEYGDKVRAIFKTNGGQASAFNVGFEVSTGDLILFLDSDDILLPEAAETAANAWRDGIARVFFPLVVIDADGKHLGRLAGGSEVPDPTLGPFGVDSPTSGNVFSRKVLERIMPVPEERKICADAYLTPASSLIGQVVGLNQPLGKYRVHGKNNVAGAAMGIPEIRRAIGFTLQQHEHLQRIAADKIGPLEKWLGAYPQHWVARITSLRESPHDHPWPDTLPGLVRRAVKATWRQPYWNTRRKLAYTFLVIAYGGLPKKAACILRAMEGHSRDPILRGLLGRGTVSPEKADEVA